MDRYDKVVHDFRTKYKEGFTWNEILELIKVFPTIDETKFSEAIGVVTCLVVDDNSIFYRHDVSNALRNCMGNITLSIFEFD
jgi:hypothetical protein